MATSEAGKRLLELSSGFEAACALGAACELDLFAAISRRAEAPTAPELAAELRLDPRGLDALATALVAIGVLTKDSGRLGVATEYARALDPDSPESVFHMTRHKMSCLRAWSGLAWTVRAGIPAPKTGGILGPLEENRSFIQAMNDVGRELAPKIASKLRDAGLLGFNRLLDLGGASGTYTLAFLENAPNPRATATIFDLPIAVGEARRRLARSPLGSRIDVVEGDFYRDEFPGGVDFIWISAIIHQQDDEATAEMFRKSWRALEPGGRVAVRDVFIDAERKGPRAAAFFNVNMLVNTMAGKVYSLDETFELLASAGFKNPRLALPANDMSAVVVAEKEK
ncbi:MAG: methyltransferase domain-containing protein [Thermoguttaceae bacterium]|nr:methyltransferase domain-containing protein [Thermoguttaceae bacterium]